MTKGVLATAPSIRNPAPINDTEAQAMAAEILALLHKGAKATAAERARELHLQTRLAIEFGRRQGWVLGRDDYGAQHLKGGRPQYYSRILPPYIDHPSGYRLGRRPMALVSQPYSVTPEKKTHMAVWAQRMGLVFTMPDFPSWWYPGWTSLCVFTCDPLR